METVGAERVTNARGRRRQGRYPRRVSSIGHVPIAGSSLTLQVTR